LPIVALDWALSSALQASGHHDEQARAQIAASSVGFVIGAALVVWLGLPGACISWLLRPAITFALLARPFVKVFPGLLWRFPFVRLGLATATMQAVISAGEHLFGGTPLALCAIGLAASVVFVAMLVVLRVLTMATIKNLAAGGPPRAAAHPAVGVSPGSAAVATVVPEQAHG
jgi:hypothetical protein